MVYAKNCIIVLGGVDMEFKVENKVKKYRRLLGVSAKELGGEEISEDTIYNIENGKGRVSLASLFIILNRINNFSSKAGILLNLGLKDVLISEEEALVEYCQYKLNQFSKHSFDEKIYLALLEFTTLYKSKICDELINLELGKKLLKDEPKKALGYFENIYESYEDKGQLLTHMAKAESNLNNYEEAIRLLKKSKAYIKEEDLLEHINCDIGTFLSIIREDLEAKKIFEEMFKNDIKDKSIEMICKINYAVILTHFKEYEKALEIYNELLGEEKNKAGIYYNISGLYRMMGDEEKSLVYLNKLIEYEGNKNSEFTTYALFNLAARYRDDGMFREAVVLFENSIRASKLYKKYSHSLRAYKEILQILRLQDRKNEFNTYLIEILGDINLYTSLEDKNQVLIILVEYLNGDSNEIVNEIIEKLQGENNE